MDKIGVDVEAISVNDFWWWDIKDQGLAKAICAKHNETLSAWSKQHPDRFVGMASIPLQFPQVAADTMEDAVKRLGARGVAVGGHVQGESLSSPKFDVFWAKVQELGQLAFMHPNGSGNLVQQGALAVVQGQVLQLLPAVGDARHLVQAHGRTCAGLAGAA